MSILGEVGEIRSLMLLIFCEKQLQGKTDFHNVNDAP